MNGRVGVAISTTGDAHRMGFLETCVANWFRVLPEVSAVVVTVDGSAADAAKVREVVDPYMAPVYRVGQPNHRGGRTPVVEGRQGVATNKNTGIEILMDTYAVDHLFLSDDDIWPLYPQSITKHTDMTFQGTALPHSMVNWGKHRLEKVDEKFKRSSWTWPRGSMLYLHRDAVYTVGGVVEEFGPGGHEHVEYSMRIHNAGLTPYSFVSPASYATRNGMGAAALWHAEDMPRPGEPLGNLRQRRKAITSVRRESGDWDKIEAVMARMAGSSAYVGFRAHENGRSSATLCTKRTSDGGDK